MTLTDSPDQPADDTILAVPPASSFEQKRAQLVAHLSAIEAMDLAALRLLWSEQFGTPPALRSIDLNSPDLSLGVNERGAPPAYYTLVALATLPFRSWPIVAQLYVGRLVSVALALGTFLAGGFPADSVYRHQLELDIGMAVAEHLGVARLRPVGAAVAVRGSEGDAAGEGGGGHDHWCRGRINAPGCYGGNPLAGTGSGVASDYRDSPPAARDYFHRHQQA